MAEAAPAPGKGAESRERTAYHVLKETNGGTHTYEFVAGNMANADAAVRAHLEKAENPEPADGGTYVAVPARSWKPLTVKVETKTVLKLGTS